MFTVVLKFLGHLWLKTKLGTWFKGNDFRCKPKTPNEFSQKKVYVLKCKFLECTPSQQDNVGQHFQSFFLFHPRRWVDCFKRNPYSSQDSQHISLRVLLAINMLHTRYCSMLCRNLFSAVSSVFKYGMFLNLQPPRHPVLWRKGAQW